MIKLFSFQRKCLKHCHAVLQFPKKKSNRAWLSMVVLWTWLFTGFQPSWVRDEQSLTAEIQLCLRSCKTVYVTWNACLNTCSNVIVSHFWKSINVEHYPPHAFSITVTFSSGMQICVAVIKLQINKSGFNYFNLNVWDCSAWYLQVYQALTYHDTINNSVSLNFFSEI